jgi:hypothetical protein
MCVYIGIRNDVIAVLGDVSIVHPIEGVKPYKCASGAVVRRLKQKKDRQTVRTNAPQEQRRRKEQWCVDSSKRRTVRPYVQSIRNHDTLLVHSDVLGDVRQTWTRLHRVPHHHRGDSGETQRGFTTLSIRNSIHATAMHRSTAAQIQAPNLICAGTWNGKQDQKRDVRSGEKQHHWTSQSAADERRTSTTSPPWHNTPPDRIEHHSIDQPNTIH